MTTADNILAQDLNGIMEADEKLERDFDTSEMRKSRNIMFDKTGDSGESKSFGDKVFL